MDKINLENALQKCKHHQNYPIFRLSIDILFHSTDLSTKYVSRDEISKLIRKFRSEFIEDESIENFLIKHFKSLNDVPYYIILQMYRARYSAPAVGDIKMVVKSMIQDNNGFYHEKTIKSMMNKIDNKGLLISAVLHGHIEFSNYK